MSCSVSSEQVAGYREIAGNLLRRYVLTNWLGINLVHVLPN
jgi:hypothetical protein